MKPDVIPPLLPGCCVQCGKSLYGMRPHATLCSDTCKTLNGRRKKRLVLELFRKLGVPAETIREWKKDRDLTTLTAAANQLDYHWDGKQQAWVLTP